jgi:hypothetical protein
MLGSWSTALGRWISGVRIPKNRLYISSGCWVNHIVNTVVQSRPFYMRRIQNTLTIKWDCTKTNFELSGLEAADLDCIAEQGVEFPGEREN